jgi:hypothetical protein
MQIGRFGPVKSKWPRTGGHLIRPRLEAKVSATAVAIATSFLRALIAEISRATSVSNIRWCTGHAVGTHQWFAVEFESDHGELSRFKAERRMAGDYETKQTTGPVPKADNFFG